VALSLRCPLPNALRGRAEQIQAELRRMDMHLTDEQLQAMKKDAEREKLREKSGSWELPEDEELLARKRAAAEARASPSTDMGDQGGDIAHARDIQKMPGMNVKKAKLRKVNRERMKARTCTYIAADRKVSCFVAWPKVNRRSCECAIDAHSAQ
jgi:hypothetical protein